MQVEVLNDIEHVKRSLCWESSCEGLGRRCNLVFTFYFILFYLFKEGENCRMNSAFSRSLIIEAIKYDLVLVCRRNKVL